MVDKKNCSLLIQGRSVLQGRTNTHCIHIVRSQGEFTMTEIVKDVRTADDDEEFIDETLVERLWGLTEMFPESVRSACSTVTSFTWDSTKVCFKFSRNAMWILASSFTILILPVMFEKERASMQEMQLQQQRQILLGPNTAVSGQGQSVMGMMPPGLTPSVASSPQ